MTQTLIEVLTADHNVAMQYEIALMLGAFLASAVCLKKRSTLSCIWGAIFLFFIYIHRILLPFLISGAYLILICSVLSLLLQMSPRAFFAPIVYLRNKADVYMKRENIICTAIILTVLLIQLCRINVCIDYDSIRYGLRSDVLLTSSEGIKGFFTNKGLVNNVYVYPKGFELLTLPMYFGDTYGNILCVNIWMLIAVILISGECVKTVYASDRAECLAAMFIVLIPGITNMAISAKSDLITLFCQLVFIYCVLRYIAENEEQGKEGAVNNAALTGIGVGALILSLSFKQTAFIFSSFIGIVSLIYLLVRKVDIRINAKGLRILVPACIFTAVITMRTYLITGYPISGVFGEVFEHLGFSLNYPFRNMSLTDGSDGLMFKDKLIQLVRRIFRLTICPTGDDMSHVFMCWSGLVFILMLIVIVFYAHKTAERAKELKALKAVKNEGAVVSDSAYDYLKIIWLAAAFISIIALYFIYQVDGNYFMLCYALSVILGVGIYAIGAGYESLLPAFIKRRVFSLNYRAAILLMSAVMIYFTAFTGWCGPIGFTKVDFINRGYYVHSIEYDYPPLWSDDSRVVAFAYEPDCYRLNGRVESWVDIDGSGGNVFLTDTKLDIFKEYLSFADIDYIYADLDFLFDKTDLRRERAGVLFVYLLEDGCFSNIYLTEGSSNRIVAEIDKERAAVSWEDYMGVERSERTAAQMKWFRSIS